MVGIQSEAALIAEANAQRAAIAEFGIEALRTDDLDALLTKGVALVGRGLGVERAKVLELIEPDKKLLIRAGVGWHPDVVGKVTIDADQGSAAGYALLTGKPVISDDVEHDERFYLPEVLRKHGIKSAINVIISGSDKPFGVLEVDSQETRSFNQDDVNFLQSYANLMAAAIDRLKSHRELSELVKQRNVLLRELQHRVKNTLQIISAFVALERRKIDNEEALAPLAAIFSRVQALSTLYDKLVPTDGQRVVDFCDYIEEICKGLVLSEQKMINLEMHCTSLTLDVEQAFPLGLIANEFVLNSMKHAFPDGRGTISVMLEQMSEGNVRLVFKDDGIGASDPYLVRGSGLHLIEQLAEQAHASLSWDMTSGTAVTLIFLCQMFDLYAFESSRTFRTRWICFEMEDVLYAEKSQIC